MMGGSAIDVRAGESCLRCERAKPRQAGADWCCWELRLLKDLMSRAAPPSMREMTGAHFIGRSAKSIEAACRRYGLKIPDKGPRGRRRRCASCLNVIGGAACAVCSTNERHAA